MVTSRPHLLLSVAMSIDDMRNARLMLSNEADFDRVDEIRAGVDAILVGANTIRRDNPRLLVRSAPRRRERVQRGVAEHPMKVTLTGRGDLDVAARFFTAGNNEKLVYTRDPAVRALRESVGHVATVVGAGEQIDLGAVLLFRHDLDRWSSSAEQTGQAQRLPALLPGLVRSYPQEVFLAAREQERPSRRHVITSGVFGPPATVVCVTDFPPRIEGTSSTVKVKAVGKEIDFVAKAEPTLRMMLSGNPTNIEHVTEATGVNAGALAQGLIHEGLCA